MKLFKHVRKIEHAGIDGMIVYFSGDPLLANQRVQQYLLAITTAQPKWIRSVVPAYDSLLVCFDCFRVDSHFVYRYLAELAVETTMHEESSHHQIPVWYSAPQTDDFEQIKNHTGLEREEIIDLHTTHTFQVFAVGFAPGFAYMGELPDELICPRLATPRKKVPQGAVAIAERQTAIYPFSSPGGWNLLGLCPWYHNLNDPGDLPEFAVGDHVTFFAITQEQFEEIASDK
ncbi:allophanate hydrolase subunit 1 [Alteromonas ponticola]|uniref:Allophanate hydrolase subunit 1 n=1 Tax=Alteromonas aquimaris TaxID=2998417 RepID=A0ABT3P7D0_9ALTE|nr:allophanate hydrolase subunit 1 [Alteromonas aquimaris]MCW8108678.1 allophanate hydrolase subunit 1 [Alteromonas aquimaris]